MQEYSHAYLLAITLMGMPVFFQEVQKLSPEARAEIRPLMQAWRKHRPAINRGYVSPIGAEPDDRSWTGFQSYAAEDQSGYLMIFRELHNDQPTAKLKLHHAAGKTLKLVNVLTDETFELPVDQDGLAEFHLPDPASFMWSRYEAQGVS